MSSAETFDAHRKVLTAVAYRVVGQVSDAEDVVQEAWLRWSRADRSQVTDARAYLVRTTVRLAIDRLRRVQARREQYVGEWLPEPAPALAADPQEAAELADSVSLALLVVLERLSPLERAVFVLREAFDAPYAEIAEVVGRSEPAVRQLAARAKRHVAEARPRFDADQDMGRRATERFLAATADGSYEDLLAVLAPDAVLLSDHGGRVKAPQRRIHGADKVARFLLAVAQTGTPDMAVALWDPAAGPGFTITQGGGPFAGFGFAVAEDQITEIYMVMNPDKLTHLLD